MLLVLLVPVKSYENDIQEDDILGFWLSEKKDGIVQVKKVNNDYKGYLVWINVLESGEKTIVLDDKNPDKSQKKRNLWGIELFHGFTFDGQWAGGEIYDPDSGKTYKCKMELDPSKDTLKLRGYVGIPLFGRTSHWSRVKDITQYKKIKNLD